jgi:hypothetical protein
MNIYLTVMKNGDEVFTIHCPKLDNGDVEPISDRSKDRLCPLPKGTIKRLLGYELKPLTPVKY